MPIGFSFAAALAFMLLLWQDMSRRSRTSRMHLAIRAALCAGIVFVIIQKGWALGGFRALTWADYLAILAGAIASIWFGLRAAGWSLERKAEEPLPSIFESDDETPGS